jgi:hypothetical protein
MAKSQEKRRKYAGYLLEPEVFFPLPFSRTNALSREIFDFCEAVDKHFPDHFRVERKLRATFARAVYVGVAQHVNLAVRRMQVSCESTGYIPRGDSFSLYFSFTFSFGSARPSEVVPVFHIRIVAPLSDVMYRDSGRQWGIKRLQSIRCKV